MNFKILESEKIYILTVLILPSKVYSKKFKQQLYIKRRHF